MIKYTDTQVTFAEVPDEVTLCINISNCQNNCVGCHSPQLRNNIGEKLTHDKIEQLMQDNKGITCICFMGLGNDIPSLCNLIRYIKYINPSIKIAIYSGDDYFESDIIDLVNYYKVGHYSEILGPLNNENTNQRMYKVNHDGLYATVDDITWKFWNTYLNNN